VVALDHSYVYDNWNFVCDHWSAAIDTKLLSIDLGCGVSCKASPASTSLSKWARSIYVEDHFFCPLADFEIAVHPEVTGAAWNYAGRIENQKGILRDFQKGI